MHPIQAAAGWTAFASILLLSVALPLETRGADTSFRTIAVGPKPESVTRGFGGRLFITLMGETRKDGDGDGRIVVLEGDSTQPFATGFDDPKGIVFTGDRLITADFTRIWSIDAAGHKVLLADSSSFPRPPLYLNDVALDPGGRGVLVTDMGARDRMLGPDGLWPLDSPEAQALPAVGRVYRIDPGTGKVSVVVESSALMPCPNGVDALPDGRIRVAEFFTGNLLEWRTGELTVLATGYRSVDTIAHDRDGTRLFVTEVFTGRVWQLDPDGNRPVLLATLSSAADAFVDDDAQQLIVPDTKAGTLAFLPFHHLLRPGHGRDE